MTNRMGIAALSTMLLTANATLTAQTPPSSPADSGTPTPAPAQAAPEVQPFAPQNKRRVSFPPLALANG